MPERKLIRLMQKGGLSPSAPTIRKWISSLSEDGGPLMVLPTGKGRGHLKALIPSDELASIAKRVGEAATEAKALAETPTVSVDFVDDMQMQIWGATELIFRHTMWTSIQLQSVENEFTRSIIQDYYYNFLTQVMGYLGRMARDNPVTFEKLVDREVMGYILKMGGKREDVGQGNLGP
jgi:hypothetical protein